MEKVGLFDFISNINQGLNSPDLFDEVYADESLNDFNDSCKAYSQFMVNRALSQFPDTIFIANESTRMSVIPDKMHYDFIKHIIRPKKRFGKWAKAPKNEVLVELIMKEYCYSEALARQSADLFTPEAKKALIKKYDTGGKK